jgi:hypothetical protein
MFLYLYKITRSQHLVVKPPSCIWSKTGFKLTGKHCFFFPEIAYKRVGTHIDLSSLATRPDMQRSDLIIVAYSWEISGEFSISMLSSRSIVVLIPKPRQ